MYTHNIQSEGRNKSKHKKSPSTSLNGARINIVKTLHYANVLWFLSDRAGKLDDGL